MAKKDEANQGSVMIIGTTTMPKRGIHREAKMIAWRQCQRALHSKVAGRVMLWMDRNQVIYAYRHVTTWWYNSSAWEWDIMYDRINH
eukprot:scaffold40490_cov18-Prasinocladus_malaysianus.AAC.1